MDIHKTFGDFTWMWGQTFFITTHNEDNEKENFVWLDPNYGGDNTIRPYSGSLQDYCEEKSIDYGRNKGVHLISEYCGNDVVVLK